MEKRFSVGDIVGVIIGVIIGFPLVMALALLSSLYNGWAFAYIWNNVVTHFFMLGTITVGQAMIIFLTVGLLRWKYEKVPTYKGKEWVTPLLSTLFQPLLFIFMAKLIEYFFI